MPPTAPFRRRPPVWAAIVVALAALLGITRIIDDDARTPPSAGASERAATVPAAAAAVKSPVTDDMRAQMSRMAERGVTIRHGRGMKKLVALTFDDGPGPLTPRVVATLGRLGVPATFYVQGGLVDLHPDILRATVAAGHEIGAHGWSHRDLRTTRGADFRHEVFDTRARIQAVTGTAPATMRPPYGAIDDRVLADAAPAGMVQVLWDVDTNDWQGGTARRIADHVIANATAGSIVLMHDGGERRVPTIKALPRIVRALRAKGIEFVTVSQLLTRDPPRDLDQAPDDGAPLDLSAPEPGPSSTYAAPPSGG